MYMTQHYVHLIYFCQKHLEILENSRINLRLFFYNFRDMIFQTIYNRNEKRGRSLWISPNSRYRDFLKFNF